MSSIGGSMPCSGASRTSVISFMRPTISRIRSAPSFARSAHRASSLPDASRLARMASPPVTIMRSEEHTSELQSLAYLVCRLLLEKKKKEHSTRLQSQANIVCQLLLENNHRRRLQARINQVALRTEAATLSRAATCVYIE